MESTIAALEISESQLKNLAKNLRELLSERKITESNLAQSLNMPIMTIRRLVSGETTDPRISTLKLIADFFHIPVDSLIGDSSFDSMPLISRNTPKFVPIIDWNALTNIKTIAELDLKKWKEWQPVMMNNQASPSSLSFALQSRPSMQPRYPLGTLFIIDPKETPTDGDVILVKMKSSGELSLRELIMDSPKWQLQPIITGSETLFYDNNKHEIAGIVILTMLHTRKDKN